MREAILFQTAKSVCDTQVVPSINMMERRPKERESSRRAFDGVKKMCFFFRLFSFPISLIIFKDFSTYVFLRGVLQTVNISNVSASTLIPKLLPKNYAQLKLFHFSNFLGFLVLLLVGIEVSARGNYLGMNHVNYLCLNSHLKPLCKNR